MLSARGEHLIVLRLFDAFEDHVLGGVLIVGGFFGWRRGAIIRNRLAGIARETTSAVRFLLARRRDGVAAQILPGFIAVVFGGSRVAIDLRDFLGPGFQLLARDQARAFFVGEDFAGWWRYFFHVGTGFRMKSAFHG